MTDNLAEVRKLEKKFIGFEIKYIPRNDNCLANSLFRQAFSRSAGQIGIFIERLSKPFVKSSDDTVEGVVVYETYNQLGGLSEIDAPKGVVEELVALLEYEDSWIDPIRKFLQDRVMPEDDALLEQVFRRSRMYTLVDDVLYRRCAHGILMKCISQKQVRELLEEIHGRVCVAYAFSRTLVGKAAFKQGFY